MARGRVGDALMQKGVTAVVAFGVVALVGFAVWFRTTSLESMPFPDADEAWTGVQAQYLLSGHPLASRTPSGNPLSPFYVGLEAPLLAVFRPALWVLRVPSVICGLLAIGLTYVLGARMFDHTTALIASTAVAVLPVTIIFSRIGYDASQTPLFTLLAIYYAYRARWIPAAFWFSAAYLVHPTNLFLLPVVLSVFLARALRDAAGDRVRQARIAIATLTIPPALVLATGLLVLRRPIMRAWYRERAYLAASKHDVLAFLTLLRRLFLAITDEVPEPVRRHHDLIFWGTLLALVCLGSASLARQRQWDRLALVWGFVLSATGFFVVAGTQGIHPEWVSWLRYGLFLVVPGTLAVSCLARSLLIDPRTPLRAALRNGQVIVLLAVGAAALVSVKQNWFERYARCCGESVWTFRTDFPDANKRALDLLAHVQNAAPAGSGKLVIIAEHHWVRRPLQFLTQGCPNVVIRDFVTVERWYTEASRPILVEHMKQGAWAIGYLQPDDAIEKAVLLSFPRDEVDRWELLRTPDGTAPPVPDLHLVLYRLKRPAGQQVATSATSPGRSSGGVRR